MHTLPTRTAELCKLLGIRYPIIQAPIGSASCTALAAAVSQAGGLGGLALTWLGENDVRRSVGELVATAANFHANFVLAFDGNTLARTLESTLDAGARVVTFSWGDPQSHVATAKACDALVGVQVTTAAGAVHALDCGADFLICQGVEAGGHVQATRALDTVLREVLAVAGGAPVVAAGGLATAAHVKRVVDAGAAGAMLGTRFVATTESCAHDDYKASIVGAAPDVATLTTCFDGEWPHAPHRVLRNATLEAWEGAGCPPPGRRPGERDIIAFSDGKRPIPRYADATPLKTTRGAVREMALYAGMGCGDIHEVLDAAAVVRALGGTFELGGPP